MVFCSECGQKIDGSSLFCPNCGQKVQSEPSYHGGSTEPPFWNSNTYHAKMPTQKLAEREQLAGIVWIVVAAIQGVTAVSVYDTLSWLSSLLGIDMTTGVVLQIAVSALNGFGAYRAFKRGEKLRKKQHGIVAEYENLLVMSIVFVVANVLLGSFIGIAGAIFDLCNRYYALNNAKYLEN